MGKTHKKNGNGSAKAHGLKMVITSNNDVSVATFGNKTKPTIIEQTLDFDTKEKIYDIDEKNFDASIEPIKILKLVAKKKINNEKECPEYNIQVNQNRKDLLGFKDKLEAEMFVGSNYKDNLHVQIAYNVLDFKKIIGLYIGDVLNSIQRLGRTHDDVIGTIMVGIKYDDLKEPKKGKIDNVLKNLYKYSIYFDEVFKNDNSLKDDYDILRILSLIRQSVVHDSTFKNSLFTPGNNEALLDLANKAMNFVKNDFNLFKENFSSNSIVNVRILNKKLGENNWGGKYYDYVLRRDNKNIGFSITKIKTKFIEFFFNGKEDEIKTFFGKLSTLFEFLIFEYYKDASHEIFVTSIIESLRECRTEEEKEIVYEKEFQRLISENILKKELELISTIDAEYISNVKEESKGYKLNVQKSSWSFNYFPSLIYVLCKFLDQKEVSELTTSIINKLENIKSLILTAKDLKIWDCDFIPELKIFNENQINDIIDEFRVVYNLSVSKRKLKKVEPNTNNTKISKALYIDALNMFKKDNFVDANNLSNYVQLEKTDKKNALKKTRKFLINNIIKNRRFIYLLKYIDPKDCHKLVTNEKILEYIFKGEKDKYLPDSIIESYYSKITGKKINLPPRDKMTNILINLIKEVDISTVISSAFDSERIEKQKQIFTLYLTICYLIVKGLINTNSVYLLACSAYDRDAYYAFGAEEDRTMGLKLLNRYLEGERSKAKPKTRVIAYLEKNIITAKTLLKYDLKQDNLFIGKCYRDAISHFNFVNMAPSYINRIKSVSSFFDLYNFTVQNWYLEKAKEQNIDDGYVEQLRVNLEKYGKTQKDFLKIINVPFAYNLARYKNLTIEDLFYDRYNLKGDKETSTD